MKGGQTIFVAWLLAKTAQGAGFSQITATDKGSCLLQRDRGTVSKQPPLKEESPAIALSRKRAAAATSGVVSQMSVASGLDGQLQAAEEDAEGIAREHARGRDALEEDAWVPVPHVNDIDFIDNMMKLFAARPLYSLESDAEVSKVGANIRPMNQTYDHNHPHYDFFWLVAHVLLKLVQPEGLLLEFGVAQGSSATLSGGIIQESQRPTRVYYGFDVFTGLPEAWGEFAKGSFANPDGALPAVPQNVQLVKGLFNDTLPPFLAEHPGPVAFINVDCDLYTGAIEVLRDLRSRMVPGTIIHFHEINQFVAPTNSWPQFVAQELKALQSWLQHEGGGMELEMLNIAAWGEAAVLRVVSTPQVKLAVE